MSNYTAFYNTLNALEAENQKRRINIDIQRTQPYLSGYTRSINPMVDYFNPQNSLRRSRNSMKMIQNDNTRSRQKIQEQLHISEVLQKKMQNQQKIQLDLINRIIEQKHHKKIQRINKIDPNLSPYSCYSERSTYLYELDNSRKKINITNTP